MTARSIPGSSQARTRTGASVLFVPVGSWAKAAAHSGCV